MLSLFLVFVPPPREEAKRRRDNPGLVSPLRPGDRSGYTRIWRRRPRRVGCAPRHRHCALITQRERDCCYWQLSFFTRFVEVVGLGMQPFACSSPSKPFRPHVRWRASFGLKDPRTNITFSASCIPRRPVWLGERRIIYSVAVRPTGSSRAADGGVDWLEDPPSAGDHGMAEFWRSVDTV